MTLVGVTQKQRFSNHAAGMNAGIRARLIASPVGRQPVFEGRGRFRAEHERLRAESGCIDDAAVAGQRGCGSQDGRIDAGPAGAAATVVVQCAGRPANRIPISMPLPTSATTSVADGSASLPAADIIRWHAAIHNVRKKSGVCCSIASMSGSFRGFSPGARDPFSKQ
jgi:hypothetical protein